MEKETCKYQKRPTPSYRAQVGTNQTTVFRISETHTFEKNPTKETYPYEKKHTTPHRAQMGKSKTRVLKEKRPANIERDLQI